MSQTGWQSKVSLLALVALVGCATYSMDLDRARRHYQETQFEHALALFRVLERDLDSLTPAERTQYAYLRGMTDYRLSSGAGEGQAASETQQSFRAHARYWLGLSAAMEKKDPGSITAEEKQRLDEALTDLNRDVYGGAAPEGDETSDDGAAPAAPSDPAPAPAAPPPASPPPASPSP